MLKISIISTIRGRSLQEMQIVMREIAGQIQFGGFSLSEEGYQELKRDYLALVITVVDIVDGAAYLFEKEPPVNRRNWKAKLELEQFRHGNSSDRYLHFAANTVRKRSGRKQKSIANGDSAWIFACNSEGI